MNLALASWCPEVTDWLCGHRLALRSQVTQPGLPPPGDNTPTAALNARENHRPAQSSGRKPLMGPQRVREKAFNEATEKPCSRILSPDLSRGWKPSALFLSSLRLCGVMLLPSHFSSPSSLSDTENTQKIPSSLASYLYIY